MHGVRLRQDRASPNWSGVVTGSPRRSQIAHIRTCGHATWAADWGFGSSAATGGLANGCEKGRIECQRSPALGLRGCGAGRPTARGTSEVSRSHEPDPARRARLPPLGLGAVCRHPPEARLRSRTTLRVQGGGPHPGRMAGASRVRLLVRLVPRLVDSGFTYRFLVLSLPLFRGQPESLFRPGSATPVTFDISLHRRSSQRGPRASLPAPLVLDEANRSIKGRSPCA